MRASTEDAVAQTRRPVGRLLEHVPVVGANLTAFRQTTELVDGVVRDGLGPLATAANGLSVESLKPKDGRIDLAPLQRMAPAVVSVDDAIQTATRSAEAIDTRTSCPSSGPDRPARRQLDEVAPLSAQARMPLLPAMLGGDGTRHYLLMFQNNAEERASGGNPASLALLTIDDGAIGSRPAGQLIGLPDAVRHTAVRTDRPGQRGLATVYTDYASTRLTNITMTPDFPTTARMARAMWRKEFGGQVDGVISFDPVALSYLLRATGPLELADGTKLRCGQRGGVPALDGLQQVPGPRRPGRRLRVGGAERSSAP